MILEVLYLPKTTAWLHETCCSGRLLVSFGLRGSLTRTGVYAFQRHLNAAALPRIEPITSFISAAAPTRRCSVICGHCGNCLVVLSEIWAEGRTHCSGLHPGKRRCNVRVLKSSSQRRRWHHVLNGCAVVPFHHYGITVHNDCFLWWCCAPWYILCNR